MVDGKATKESGNAFDNYIPRVANCKLQERKDPGIGELFRLRGYLRTFMRFRDWECMNLLREARAAGMEVDEMRRLALQTRNFHSYWQVMREVIDGPHT